MIYLDHAATTPVLPAVLDAMLPWMQPDHVGNPGSVHAQGVAAKEAVENARYHVAKLIGARSDEIIFTSGASESNTLWHRLIREELEKSAIFYSQAEHHSVSHSDYPYYSSKNAVRVDQNGALDIQDLKQKLRNAVANDLKPGAISTFWVNNETGAINPISDIANVAYTHSIPLHIDGSQAVGHIKTDVECYGIDFLTISGHKFGGPLGVGALYVNKRWKRNSLKPDINGGGQEFGLRSGTENVPGIVGLGKASEIAYGKINTLQNHWIKLRAIFVDSLSAQISRPFYVNGGKHVSNNIISLTIPGVHSEALLLMLDTRGICVSAGSACSAHKPQVSHVLLAMGFTPEDAASTLRISMGTSTSATEVVMAATAISEAVKVYEKINL